MSGRAIFISLGLVAVTATLTISLTRKSAMPTIAIPVPSTAGTIVPTDTPSPFWMEQDGRPVRFLTTVPSETFEDQSLTLPTGRMLPFFVFYNILDPHRKSDRYRLANKLSVIEGWVSGYQGILITSRQGIDIRRMNEAEAKVAGGQPGEAAFDLSVPIGASEAELKQILEGAPDAPKPLALLEHPKLMLSTFMKWPLTDTKEITVHGKRVQIHEVCLIGADDVDAIRNAPPTPGPYATLNHIKQEDLDEVIKVINKLDICFVMDLTNSMRPWHEAFRDRIVALATGLHSQFPDVDLKIGWGAYQDILGGQEHYIGKFNGSFLINKSSNQLLDLKKAVEGTELLEVSSVDYPECVFWGTHLALENFGWRDHARRVLVVCGDAENHPETSAKNHGGFTERDMADKVRKTGVVLCCIHTNTEHGKALAAQVGHISTLAAAGGDSANLDGGKSLPIEATSEEFSKMLSSLLSGRVSKVADEGRAVAALRSVTSPENRKVGKTIKALDPEQRALIVRILESRSEGQLSQKFRMIINVVENGTLVDKEVDVAVHRGWIPETIAGTPVVETHELISKDEIKLIQDYLRELQELDRADAPELLAVGRFAAVFGDHAKLTQWLKKDDAAEPLSRYMLQKHHIVTRTTLFQLTKDDFRSMSAQHRIEMLRLADKYDDYLQEILGISELWRRIGEVDYIWLPSRELP